MINIDNVFFSGIVIEPYEDNWCLTCALKDRQLSPNHVTLFWEAYLDNMSPLRCKKLQVSNNIVLQIFFWIFVVYFYEENSKNISWIILNLNHRLINFLTDSSYTVQSIVIALRQKFLDNICTMCSQKWG